MTEHDIETCDCACCGSHRFSMKLYDAFQPVRDILEEFPELKNPLVDELGKAMTQAFASNFYGRSPHDR